MKELRLFSFLTMCVLVACLTLTSSCTQEQVIPASQSQEEISLQARTDFSGLEDIVIKKIAERENISESSITYCAFIMTTAQGYGRYDFTAGTLSGSYFITGIIGDDYEGF